MSTTRKRKEKASAGHSFSFFESTHSMPINEGFCSGGQCFVGDASVMPPIESSSAADVLWTQQRMESPSESGPNHAALPDSEDSFYNYIPPELFEKIKQAARQGLLTSALLTLLNEMVTDYLSVHKYEQEHIYWINQALRGFALLAIGASLEPTLSLPFANYFLTEYIKLDKEKATYLTTGAVISVNMLTSPTGWIESALPIAVGIGSSVLGGSAIKYGYNLVRNHLFAAKPAENSEPLSNKMSPSTR